LPFGLKNGPFLLFLNPSLSPHKLSKKEIINLTEAKLKTTFYVSEEIHEEMLNNMKQNMNKNNL